MGRTCFVPNCTTGYRSNKEGKTSLFLPPKDLINEWKRLIARQDRTLTKRDFVCAKHFEPTCILRQYDDGVISYPLRTARLAKGSVPTIFPNFPDRLSRTKGRKRKLTSKKQTFPKEEFQEVASISEDTEDRSYQFEEGSRKGLFTEIWAAPQLIYPNGSWNYHKIQLENKKYLSICKMYISDHGIAKTEKQITLHEDGTLLFAIYDMLFINDELIQLSCNNVGELENIIKTVDELNICTGGSNLTSYNSDKINLKHASPDYNLQRWRHKLCPLVLSDSNISCCSYCRTLHKPSNTRKKTKKRSKLS